MRKSDKLVSGIGIKGMTYFTQIEGEELKEYTLWAGMLYRCTQKYWDRFPTYIGVTCSENFKSYAFFYEWCNSQTGFNEKDKNGRNWSLDKDILIRGNRHYSEDICVFVPERLNSLLVKGDAARGEWPIGVYRSKNSKKFKSRCSNGNGKQKHLGSFNTPREAFLAYKTFKEALIKEVANEYKEQLDSRVYEALMNYEVNEND